MKNMFNVTTVLPHSLLQTNPCNRHNFSTQVFRKSAAQLHYVGPELRYIYWPPLELCRTLSEDLCRKVVTNARVRLQEVVRQKRWSHWTCSSLRTIFQPMRITSVPGVKCFCKNKNVLSAQTMVWHFVRHPVFYVSRYVLRIYVFFYWKCNICFEFRSCHKAPFAWQKERCERQIPD